MVVDEVLVKRWRLEVEVVALAEGFMLEMEMEEEKGFRNLAEKAVGLMILAQKSLLSHSYLSHDIVPRTLRLLTAYLSSSSQCSFSAPPSSQFGDITEVMVGLLRACCDGRARVQASLANLLFSSLSGGGTGGREKERLWPHPLMSVLYSLFQFKNCVRFSLRVHPDSWGLCPFLLPLSLLTPTNPSLLGSVVVGNSEGVMVHGGRHIFNVCKVSLFFFMVRRKGIILIIILLL